MAKIILTGRGQPVKITTDTPNIRLAGLHGKVFNAEVTGTWVIFESENYGGRYATLAQGTYVRDDIEELLGTDSPTSVKRIDPIPSISLYQHSRERGRRVILTGDAPNLSKRRIDNDATSITVESGTWVLYDLQNYWGRSATIGPGKYTIDDVNRMIGLDVVSSVKFLVETPEPSIVLYDHTDAQGRSITLTEDTPSLTVLNNKTSAVHVKLGTWALFDGSNYQGEHTTLSPGRYNTEDIRELVGNNKVSSIKLIDPTPSISLFQHSRERGRQVILTSDAPDLGKYRMDNDASSITVESGTWVLYELHNYLGKSATVGPGKYSIEDVDRIIGKDAVSSVKVQVQTVAPSGEIVLFEHDEEGGQSVTLTSDTPRLGTQYYFNDKLSSVNVKLGTWALFKDDRYRGNYITLSQGRYNKDDITKLIGDNTVSSVKNISPIPSISLFQHSRERGRQVVLTGDASNLGKHKIDNDATSITVESGNWTLYDMPDFWGRSATIGPGKHTIDDVNRMIGLDIVSSVKYTIEPLEPCIVLYEHSGAKGKKIKLTENASSLGILGNKVSCVDAKFGTWALFDATGFGGNYATLAPGRYDKEDIAELIGDNKVSSVKLIDPTPSITLFQHSKERGRSAVLTGDAPNLGKRKLNNDATSISVESGTWVLYDLYNYEGRSAAIGPGKYTIADVDRIIGLDSVSSVKFQLPE